MSELLYRVALTNVPKIGAVHAKNLIAHCGSAEAVFKSRKSDLLKIHGIGSGVSKHNRAVVKSLTRSVSGRVSRP